MLSQYSDIILYHGYFTRADTQTRRVELRISSFVSLLSMMIICGAATTRAITFARAAVSMLRGTRTRHLCHQSHD